MLPLQMSSGDLLADRRAAYGEACLPDDPVAAADLFRQALELVPGWAAGWYRLGEILGEDAPEAAEAFRRALEADPADRLGAALKLDLLRDRTLSDSLPSAFVETLFDQYAQGFEEALVGRLDYCAPQLLAEELGGACGRVLDLGCGTGLMGAEIAGRCDWLEGWDISSEMLRLAEEKGLYDRLARRDLSKLEPAADSWDLITAADVFAYLGALERIVGWADGALRAGGMLAFTVELHEGAEAYVLRESRRYAHSEPHLRALLEEAGFTVRMRRAVLRQDRGAPIHGLVVLAEKTAGRQADDTRFRSAPVPAV